MFDLLTDLFTFIVNIIPMILGMFINLISILDTAIENVKDFTFNVNTGNTAYYNMLTKGIATYKYLVGDTLFGFINMMIILGLSVTLWKYVKKLKDNISVTTIGGNGFSWSSMLGKLMK